LQEKREKRIAKKAAKKEAVASVSETAKREQVLSGIGFQVDEMLAKFGLTGPEYVMVRVRSRHLAGLTTTV